MDPREHSAARVAWLQGLPKQVDVYEVGPRDGLQNEPAHLATEDKARLIRALVDSGERRIELSSFVSPKWIPQLADADILAKSVERPKGVTFSALVPNRKGLDRALAAGVSEVGVFVSATESHSKKNLNKSIAEAFAAAEEVTRAARAANIRVRGYLSVVWGCPFEGAVKVSTVVELCRRLAEMGTYEVSLGDTIGIGTPGQTARILESVLEVVPVGGLALHLHDTRGTALANALVGLSLGIRTFDASVGGLGGCPYAPGAAGNLATEDLVFMLNGLGIETGIDLTKLVVAGELAQDLVGRKLTGKYLQAALGEREKRARRRGQT